MKFEQNIKKEKERELNQDLIDTVRRVTYPSALLTMALLFPHIGEAVEIPENFSYEQGIELLHQGAISDKMETSAIFLDTEHSSTWYSHEGLPTEYSYRYSDIVKALGDRLQKMNIQSGDEVVLNKTHTHPIYGAKTLGMFEEGNDSNVISNPPSVTGPYADTSIHKHGIYEKRIIKPLEKSFGVSIKMQEQVIDPLGVWTYAPSEDAKQLYASDKEQMRLARFAALEVKHQWIKESQHTPINELRESDLYKQLIQAFAAAGVDLSYKPFKDKK